MSNKTKLVLAILVLVPAAGIFLKSMISSENALVLGESNSAAEQSQKGAIGSEEGGSEFGKPDAFSDSHLDLESSWTGNASINRKDDEHQRISPVARIFDYEVSLVEGLDEMGEVGLLSYDEKVKNLALWSNLCSKSKSELSVSVDQFPDPGSVYAKINSLCREFGSKASEIDEFAEVEIDERSRGTGDRARLESSLEELGPDGAIRNAIYELSDALYNLDYARVLEIVWFLGIYEFRDASEEFSLYTNQPRVETIFAVASSIYCNFIGGCGGEHPITLNLCFQFEDLPCSSRPYNIFDAINQILTGHQIDTFNEMNMSLIKLLNQPRRGKL